MSERRWTLEEIDEAFHAALRKHGTDGARSQYANSLFGYIAEHLEALPAPEELMQEVWAIKLLSDRYANDERGILTFLSKTQATTYKLSSAKVIPVTLIMYEGHHA